MNSEESVRFYLNDLKEPNISILNKKSSLTKIHSCVNVLYKEDISKYKTLLKDIFDMANSELTNENVCVQQICLLILDDIFKRDCKGDFLRKIPDIYFNVVFTDPSKFRVHLKQAALKYLSCCTQTIITNRCSDLSVFHNRMVGDKVLKEEVSNFIYKMYIELPVEKGIIFFYDTDVTTMFNCSKKLREALLELNTKLLPKYDVTSLPTDNLEDFKKKVTHSYRNVIISLKSAKDPQWFNLIVFLLKCFGRVLHDHINTVNSLSNIIEPSVQGNDDHTLQTLDRWMELINIYSANMDLLAAPKQIKFLTKPLKYNVSSNTKVLRRRFEVWCHLINALQDRATVCLGSFMNFCFVTNGASSEDCHGNYSYFTEQFEETTQVLMEMLGHSDENTCFEFSNKCLNFEKPLINSSNIMSLSFTLLTAVVKSSFALAKWMDIENIPKIITCLWSSLINTLRELDNDQREQVTKLLFSKLVVTVQTLIPNTKSNIIVINILDLLMKEQFFEKHLSSKAVLFAITKYLFSDDLHLLNFTFSSMEYTQNLILVWIESADVLMYFCDNPDATIPSESDIINFMTWPISDNHKIISYNMKQNFVAKWIDAYQRVCDVSTQGALMILKSLKVVTSSELVNTVCLFYEVFRTLISYKKIKGFDSTLIHLTDYLLRLNTLQKPDSDKLLPVVEKLLHNISETYSMDDFIMICNCCYLLLTKFQQRKLLMFLDSFINNLPHELKERVPPELSKAVKAHIELQSPLTAGACLSRMIKSRFSQLTPSMPSSELHSHTQSVSSVNHASIHSNQLNNENMKKHNKPINKVKLNITKVIDHNEEANFAIIDSEYKFDTEKLSEHQLEVLKKRNGDIPALYQDLSQSQSNSSTPNNKPISQPKNLVNSETPVKLCNTDLDVHTISQQVGSIDPSFFADITKHIRVSKELGRLKSNLVGGDYIFKINLTGKRETRRSSNQKFKSLPRLRTNPTKKIKMQKISQPFTIDRNSLVTDNTLVTTKNHIMSTGDKHNIEMNRMEENQTVTSEEFNGIDPENQSTVPKPEVKNSEVIESLNSEIQKIVNKISKLESETKEDVKIVANIDLTDDSKALDEIEVTEPQTKAIDIPTSPVEHDTPTRTSEFINDTLDISPIRINDESETVKELFQKSENTLVGEINNEFEVIPPSTPSEDKQNLHTELLPLSRSEKLLRLVSCQPAIPVNNKASTETSISISITPSKTFRIKKMMEKCGKLNQHEPTKKEQPTNKHLQLLKFDRELPSPQASPSSGILKRPMTDEGLPHPKKKKVNFPDPPLTCLKHYIPDSESELFVNKNSGVHDEISSQNDLFVDNSETLDIETQDAIDVVNVPLLNSTEAFFPDLINCNDKVHGIVLLISDSVFASSLLLELRTKGINTIGGLAKLSEVEINRLPLKSPKLSNLRSVLENYKAKEGIGGKVVIKKLCEKQNDVSGSTPRKFEIVQTPKKRLSKPSTRHNSNTSKKFNTLIVEPKVSYTCERVVPEEVLNKIIDDFEGIKHIAKKEITKMATLHTSITDIMGAQKCIEVVQENNPDFKFSSLIKEQNYPVILKDIVNNIGLKKVIEILCGIHSRMRSNLLRTLTSENLQLFTHYTEVELEDIVVHLLKQIPLSVVFNNLDLHCIIKEIFNICQNSKFSSTDFFKYTMNTFSPTIDVIAPSFRHIQLVDLNSQIIKVNASNESDLITFIDQIVNVVDNAKISAKLSENKSLFKEEDLINSLINISSSQSLVKICEKLIQQLPEEKLDDNVYESLAFSFFNKMPLSNLCRYFSAYVQKESRKG
ncbi:hypothetical protein FQA39_LY09954 [Lamprigera yunnana]|nr:hypothetical protein FQA39_LY09954 [Lamprigera yunnana]